MADPAWRVELAASFLDRLGAIEAFLAEAGADQAYDTLLSSLRDTVIPNLRRFPRMGRRYLDRPPQSAEGIALLAGLPAGAAEALRVLGSGDYLIVYALEPASARVFLLSIRHHRQLSFEFETFWPGTGREDVQRAGGATRRGSAPTAQEPALQGRAGILAARTTPAAVRTRRGLVPPVQWLNALEKALGVV